MSEIDLRRESAQVNETSAGSKFWSLHRASNMAMSHFEASVAMA